MRDKTLMFYINTIGGGGAERAIVQVANYMAQSGYKVILVTSFCKSSEYALVKEVIRINLEDHEIKSSRLKRNYRRISILRKLCRKYSPQCLISFMAEPNFRAIIATYGLPVKNIISVRNDPNKEYSGKLNEFLAKKLLPHADGCVFQTEEAKAWFPSSLQKKSEVIVNAVDTVFFNTPRKGEGNGFVTLGRLFSQKNHVMLIKAFASIAKKHSQEMLYIYGEGGEESKLKNLISKLNMKDNIKLMKYSTQAAKVFSEATAFILSSDYEGMPNSLMEALAMGLPCISTDCPCGGPKSLIQAGVNGLLTPVGDENKMQEAIEKLITDREYAEQLGSRAKIMARKFETKAVLNKWEAYISKITQFDSES